MSVFISTSLFSFFSVYVRLARHAFIAFSECILSFIMLHEGKLGAKLKKKKIASKFLEKYFHEMAIFSEIHISVISRESKRRSISPDFDSTLYYHGVWRWVVSPEDTLV